MARGRPAAVQLLAFCIMLTSSAMNFRGIYGEQLHSKTFKSPGFGLGPGDVIDRYLPVDMPKGHVALRSLKVQVVDSLGTPIPLSETYLHHWVLVRMYIDPTSTTGTLGTNIKPNDGVCSPFLVQWFGLGSETRHTDTRVPAPFGIVVGDPNDVPEGLVEVWFLNVHAIDTRGTESPLDCTECSCDLYNVTENVAGGELPPGYEGGLLCCYDQTHCPVRLGFTDIRRELFVEIAVTWVDFSDAVVPTKVYILDATDKRTAWDEPAQCMVEYTVPKCEKEGLAAKNCVHTQEAVAFLPTGGFVIYVDAHLHSAGIGASVRRENGDPICVSSPKYGVGNEAGNEAGYIVGMTTCYPEPGSMYIDAREKLMLSASYNSTERHTGVMALFYLLTAETLTPPSKAGGKQAWVPTVIVAAIGIAVVIGGVLFYQLRKRRASVVKYEPIT